MAAPRPSEAIYYPHVRFRSASWVKSLLFYWEAVHRPVPKGVEPDGDDAEIGALIEAGLVKNFPLPPFGERALELLGTRLEEQARHSGGAIPPCVRGLEHVRGVSPGFVDDALERVVKGFEGRGLHAAANIARAQGPQLLTLFVTVLNSLIARERNLSPVTDDPVFDALCTYFDQNVTDRHEEISPENALVAAQLLVPTPAAESLERLSVSELIRIRGELAKARRRFRETVQARAVAIAELPSVDAVRDHIKVLGEEISDEVEETRQALRKHRFDTRWTALGVSAPASIAVGTAVAGGSVMAVGALGGAATAVLAVTSWFFRRKSPHHQPAGNYVLAAEKAVAGAEALRLSASLKKLFSHA